MTWTYDFVGETRTIDGPLPPGRFEDLVAGFALLAPYRVNDPDVIADLRRNHVVALTADAGTPRARITVSLVPAPPGPDEIARWLNLFDVPRVPIGRRPPARPQRPIDF